MAAWKIETLESTNNSDEIVSRAHWRCYFSKESGGELYAADSCGVVELDEIETDASGFIPYGDLTESKCLEWVHGKVNKTGIEAAVTDAVNAKMDPPLKAGKPWA